MQVYSDPSREADEWVLPDVEVFYRTETALASDGWTYDDDTPLPAGWYYWYCLPGCLPDSEPFGPFATEAEAIAAAQED